MRPAVAPGAINKIVQPVTGTITRSVFVRRSTCPDHGLVTPGMPNRARLRTFSNSFISASSVSSAICRLCGAAICRAMSSARAIVLSLPPGGAIGCGSGSMANASEHSALLRRTPSGLRGMSSGLGEVDRRTSGRLLPSRCSGLHRAAGPLAIRCPVNRCRVRRSLVVEQSQAGPEGFQQVDRRLSAGWPNCSAATPAQKVGRAEVDQEHGNDAAIILPPRGSGNQSQRRLSHRLR